MGNVLKAFRALARETGGRNAEHASRGSPRDLINYVDSHALWRQYPLTGSEFKVSKNLNLPQEFRESHYEF